MATSQTPSHSTLLACTRWDSCAKQDFGSCHDDQEEGCLALFLCPDLGSGWLQVISRNRSRYSISALIHETSLSAQTAGSPCASPCVHDCEKRQKRNHKKPMSFALQPVSSWTLHFPASSQAKASLSLWIKILLHLFLFGFVLN